MIELCGSAYDPRSWLSPANSRIEGWRSVAVKQSILSCFGVCSMHHIDLAWKVAQFDIHSTFDLQIAYRGILTEEYERHASAYISFAEYRL